MLAQIVSTIAPIVVIVAIGYLFRKAIAVDVRQLTDVSLYIFTSALVFHTIVHTRIPTHDILLMGIAVVILYSLLTALSLAFGQARHLSRVAISSLLLGTLFVNSGNMGLPFNLFAYGLPGLEIASLYLVYNALLTNSAGIFIAARGNMSSLEAFTTIFKLPLIYAVLAAMLVRWTGLQKPQFFFRAIELLQQGAVPLLLTILGMQIARTRITSRMETVSFVIVMRLAISPLLAYLVTKLIGIHGLLQKVFIIQSAMPVAVNSAILAIKFDTRPNFVANAVVFSTLASLLTLSMVYFLVETFL